MLNSIVYIRSHGNHDVNLLFKVVHLHGFLFCYLLFKFTQLLYLGNILFWHGAYNVTCYSGEVEGLKFRN